MKKMFSHINWDCRYRCTVKTLFFFILNDGNCAMGYYEKWSCEGLLAMGMAHVYQRKQSETDRWDILSNQSIKSVKRNAQKETPTLALPAGVWLSPEVTLTAYACQHRLVSSARTFKTDRHTIKPSLSAKACQHRLVSSARTSERLVVTLSNLHFLLSFLTGGVLGDQVNGLIY